MRRRYITASEREQRVGPDGVKLCIWCEKPVAKGRRRYCSDACQEEVYIRARPDHARTLVHKRDRGICAGCGIDAEGLECYASAMHSVLHGHRYSTERYEPWEQQEASEFLAALRALGFDGFDGRYYHRAGFWQMDHIIPVVEGGGACGLENLRTLCTACHKWETAELARRRAKKPAPPVRARTPDLQTELAL